MSNILMSGGEMMCRDGYVTYLMQSMSAIGHDMRFFSREPEAEAQWLEANGAGLFIIAVVA